MSPDERNTPVSIIGRFSAILDCYSHRDSSLSISELSRKTGLPKSTTSRLVTEMISHGFLEHQGPKITLGLRFFELGQQAARPQTLRRLAYAQMEGLRRATGQTVHLAVLDGTHVVYIEILPTRNSPLLPSRVGGRIPAHATAVGKAILAFSNPEITEQMISEGLSKIGPNTITEPDSFRAELWRTRSRGYATESEESGTDISCVAAPILVRDGVPVAGISVSGWKKDIDVPASTSALRSAIESLTQQVDKLPSRHQTI